MIATTVSLSTAQFDLKSNNEISATIISLLSRIFPLLNAISKIELKQLLPSFHLRILLYWN